MTTSTDHSGPCQPHPTTKVCTLDGVHLDSCWDQVLCHGCRPCATHSRPVQRPASTSDARKRHAENAQGGGA